MCDSNVTKPLLDSYLETLADRGGVLLAAVTKRDGMKRQAILLVTLVITIVLLTACGGESTPPEGESTASSVGRHNVDATMTSLQDAGWKVEEPEGHHDDEEHQDSEKHQEGEEHQDTPTAQIEEAEIGYLATTAPNGEPIHLQFFKSSEEAQDELDLSKQLEGQFEGTTIGNILVFNPANETHAVSEENLQALQGLLK